jgi:protein arginine kinase activator
MDLNNFIKSTINLLGMLSVSKKHTETNKCPKCGSTLEQIAKNQKIGCANCYDYFALPLAKVIKQTQGSLKHIGKIPKNCSEKQEQERPGLVSPVPPVLVKSFEYIIEQEKNMANLVKREKYEEAAIIRDKILALKALVARFHKAAKSKDQEQAVLLQKEINLFISKNQ